MPKMTDEQIETELNALVYGEFASTFASTRAVWEMDDTDAKTLARQAFTLGQDNGKAIMLEQAERLIRPSLVSAQGVQLIVSTEALIRWCDEANHALEVRSYSVRRTVFTDPEKSWCATAHALDRSTAVFGASHAEALARLATWCRDQTRDTDRPNELPTQPNHEMPEAP